MFEKITLKLSSYKTKVSNRLSILYSDVLVTINFLDRNLESGKIFKHKIHIKTISLLNWIFEGSERIFRIPFEKVKGKLNFDFTFIVYIQ